MGGEFTAIFILLIFALAIGAGMMVASVALAPRKTTQVKQMPYESGMDPIGDARQRFDVRFSLLAIIFLLFDVELLFLYPWAVAQWSADTPAGAGAGIPAEFRAWVFWEMMVFIMIISAAFAYAWRKGAFEWR
jgi:NADH-quinone oxidoreductase subunit A